MTTEVTRRPYLLDNSRVTVWKSIKFPCHGVRYKGKIYVSRDVSQSQCFEGIFRGVILSLGEDRNNLS